MNGPWRRVRDALPRERMNRSDVVAGLPGAIGSVPDGMAAGVLAGVSPVHGLYASMAGRLFGGFSTSTRLMVVTTTSASALAAGSALTGVAPEDRPAALVLLTLIAGLVMIVASALRLGRYTRFVSHSVMTGFLAGIAANIALGQLPALVGADAEGRLAAAKALDVLTHPSSIDGASLVIGALALALMAGVARTRLQLFASLGALVVPTALVLILGWDSVTRVSEAGEIPTGFPLPALPDFTLLTPSLVSAAFAVAVIVLVQGAGVAEASPNPDGSRSASNRDFAAQGVGNVAAALFRGMPVGGSVGQTALNSAAGARTRWAAIWSGIWMLAILVAFAGLVGQVPMPTLAAVLIVAALGSLDPSRISAIWSSGYSSRIALVVTFVATLLLPVTAAVGIGVALSLLLQLNQEALDLKVVRLQVDGDRLVESRAPKQLADNEIAILDVYGSLFYAGARTLQAQLPDPATARSPVVILRLRGRTTASATFLAVVADYARRLDAVDGQLCLSGVDPRIRELWTDELLTAQGVRLEFFTAGPVLGESTIAAYAQARVWLHDRDDQ
ncbi:SulP family inorganic anion transporter [Rhodococcus triatomae]|uniref:Sulfate permease, SulP family n=1 Tax=Rhodococcus triatomae TaxID=300028 RepID=A0A1G8H227_9NOCA|nr:SulP family inorganic anion transporter [Rhodococcus triatomae]QNG20232.1 SulP family inorganic anion transporter [Rhodococcus triatomae]QNG23853.1 SulP family inorganic anion transporter [Rhodococcus triatomae]SDI00687.1 sulfate permease, SulP family [Rhodococcus triatomae]